MTSETPLTYIYSLEKAGETVWNYTLDKDNPDPIFDEHIKLTSGTKRADSKWYWLHIKDPIGSTKARLEPLFKGSIFFSGHIQIKNQSNLVVVLRAPSIKTIILLLIPGISPNTTQEFYNALPTEAQVVFDADMITNNITL